MKGIYLNPGDNLFQRCINSEIYVDKTMLIQETNSLINTERQFACVSRARRFGKTMALKMLAAYYSKGADGKVFDGLKISEDGTTFAEHLGKYNCLLIDINSFYSNATDKERMFDEMAETVRKEFVKQFPALVFDAGMNITKCIREVYEVTGEQFVILIDEYDVLARESVSAELFRKYLEFLNGLFKNTDITQAIALAYMTGIFPVVREKFQSKLNNFWEYTMLQPRNFVEYVGFTAQEVDSLCRQYKLDREECRRWYDGYRLDGYEIYAPLSVVASAIDGKFQSYWNRTSSFEALQDYIDADYDGIVEDVNALISGKNIKVDAGTFQNRMEFKCKEDVFTYCMHLGYLAYNEDDGTCRIPNYEVRQEWVRSVQHTARYSRSWEIIKASESLLEATKKGDGETVATLLGRAHRLLTNALSYNREQSLQIVVMMAYLYAREEYTVIQELPSGDGYADVAFIPYKPSAELPAIVVELKVDKAEGTGLEQIRAKHYPAVLEKYEGNMLLVEVGYNKRSRKHRCVIERQ